MIAHMLSTKVIHNPESFQLASKWQAVSRQEDNVVHNGHRFTVVCKAKLSDETYRKRRLLAILTIIFTLGIAYCCSRKIKARLYQKERLFITPEVLKAVQIAPPATEVTLEMAEKALNNGLQVSEEVRKRLVELEPKLFRRGIDQVIQILSNGQNFLTFCLPEAPDLIFKAAKWDGDVAEKRYKNTILGKQAIMKHGLDRLEMPDTILLQDLRILVEKRLPFKDGEHLQEDLYYQNQARLKPIALQLSRLIYETKDEDPSFTNYPLFEQNGELKCGVIDLELIGRSPVPGFIGGWHNSPGLIGMMPNETLIDAVIEEGERFGLKMEEKVKAKEKQLENISRYSAHQKFLQNRKIQTGLEPMMELSEIDQLGLDLDESQVYSIWDKDKKRWEDKEKTYTLREAVTDVVNHINGEIEAKTHRRAIRIPDFLPFSFYKDFGVSEKELPNTTEEDPRLWMNRILKALCEKGFIFSSRKYHNRGFGIQC